MSFSIVDLIGFFLLQILQVAIHKRLIFFRCFGSKFNSISSALYMMSGQISLAEFARLR
jgi:hypothetical protein